MQANFTITALPQGLPFFRVHCTNLELFGLVSMGITRDALRLSYMPDLTPPGDAAPLFVKTAEEAAQYFAGLLAAEVGEGRLAEIREGFAGRENEFAIHWFGDRLESFVCRESFNQAFQYASGGRELMYGASVEDDAFAAALFDIFAESFFKSEAVAG